MLVGSLILPQDNHLYIINLSFLSYDYQVAVGSGPSNLDDIKQVRVNLIEVENKSWPIGEISVRYSYQTYGQRSVHISEATPDFH